MDHESLFIYKLRDLRDRLKSRDEYNLLQVSALLRQLLQDEQPLVHSANRQVKWKVRFAVSCAGVIDHYNSIFPSKPGLNIVGDSIDPETSPRDRIDLLDLSEFLALKVAGIWGRDYTVSDLISYGAHAGGGIHHNPKGAELRDMHSISPPVQWFGMPVFVGLLGSVARVVEKALRPVEMLILRDRAIKLTEARQLQPAESVWRDALSLCELTYGPEHQEVSYVLHNLALNRHYQGKFQDAENLDRRALEILRRTLGEENAATISSKNNLAIDLERQGRHEEAISLLANVCEVLERTAAWDEQTRGCVASLIRNFRALGRNDKAAAFEDKWRSAAPKDEPEGAIARGP
jgi:tetratricopeptide (TPR) repeat protein